MLADDELLTIWSLLVCEDDAAEGRHQAVSSFNCVEAFIHAVACKLNFFLVFLLLVLWPL
jgi:hypothetical protein